MKRTLLHSTLASVFILLFVANDTYAQRHKKEEKPKEVSIYDVDTLQKLIPLNRKMWHDRIDIQQKKIRASFKMVSYSDDSILSASFQHAMMEDVDHMQKMVENMPPGDRDSYAESQEKIQCLKAIEQMLISFNRDVRPDPVYYKKLVANMHDLIIALNEGTSLDFVKNNVSKQTLNNVKALFDKPSAPERMFIYPEMGRREPQMMIKRLPEFVNDPYADDIITAAAKVVPNEIFNYASSTNVPLSNAVRRSKDPLVQTIVRVAQESKSPLKAMPFINDIFAKRKTIAEVDAITSNPDLFYQNLVRLKVENVAIGGDIYTDELQYRGMSYVRKMNELHEEKDPVRFKCIEDMSPEAMYFLMVYGQDEIYTSSFLGTFKRMMAKLGTTPGNEFLDRVHRDKFRTFIRMCAGYNTLPQFLGTMDAEHKNSLMRDFIAGLEKGKDDDLEDAVDVADAFGSIQDSSLAAFLDKQVKDNYESAYQQRSKKGVIIYGLLATLFESSRNANNSDNAAAESNRLNLPPINLVPNNKLANDSGIVYEQFFFFGDEDGKTSYASFLTNFKDGKWKIVNTNKNWSTISSTSGKPVVIYANMPVPEPGDEEAQKALCNYLDSLEIHPTIVVHRGHSYHLPLTIDHLKPEARIVMLGSCGGYHNLGKVLDHSPDAHIISSKQVGSMSVNEPIIKTINEQLLEGKDIEWISSWMKLNGIFAMKGREKAREYFVDYIPPHRNLGAIFIKAYRKMLNSLE
ncbi:MAG: hypothetical protein JST82_15945 [Bacteroidetes bacterium]|nr:hypothetical protein [Bacteroidota bacterium]